MAQLHIQHGYMLLCKLLLRQLLNGCCHTVVLLSSGADDVKGSQQTQLPQLDDRPAVGQMHLLRVRQGCRSSSGPGELLLLVVVPVISTTLAHYSRV